MTNDTPISLPIESPDEYEQYVEMLARNGLDGEESPRTIARGSVICMRNIDDDKVLYFSAEPYVDDPAEQTRLWPRDVLLHSGHYPFEASQPDDVRDLAVEILTGDLYDVMMEIENDTVPQDSSTSGSKEGV